MEDEVLTAISNLEQKDGAIHKIPFQKHDHIRITRGPMKDILGIFEHWTSDQKHVRVSLNFINYQAAVKLHHSFIEKVA